MDELSRMWAEGVAGAAENMQKAKEATGSNTTEDGSVKQQGRRVGTDRMRWVVENDILDKGEQARFWEAIADQRKRGYNKNKTFDGDLIIDVGSKLVITDGNFNNPSISTVIEFNETYEDTLAYFKGCIYETAKRFPSGYRETIGIIEEIYGSWYVTERNAGDYRTYERENGRRKGTDRRRYSKRTESSLEFQDAAKANGMNVEQDGDAVVISDKEGNPVGMLQADGSTLYEKGRDHIQDVAKRIRAAYKGLDPEGREAELMKQMVGQMDELSRMWAEGVAGAAENMQKAASNAAEKNTTREGGVKMQARNFKAEAQADITAEYNRIVDDILSLSNDAPDAVLMGYTPDVYTALGVPSLPFVIGKGHIYSIAKTKAEATMTQTVVSLIQMFAKRNPIQMGWISFLIDEDTVFLDVLHLLYAYILKNPEVVI